MNLYFDNGATSFPKPKEVAEEIAKFLNIESAPYGRSFYGRAFNVSKVVEECRDLLAETLNISDSERLTFTYNATYGLNNIIKNFKYKHKKVLVSALEHNAVMRPLNYLQQSIGLTWETLPSEPDGRVNLTKIETEKREILKDCDLIIISHISNVNGVIQPISRLKEIVGDIPILLDVAQSAGHYPINIDEWKIDFAAVTGHKSLLGPTGIGAFYISERYNLEPLIHGGTGSNSESINMPDYYPDIQEAGTPNIAGIYGLLGALKNRPSSNHTNKDFKDLIYNLNSLEELNLYCSSDLNNQGELFSLSHKNQSPSEFALKLYQNHGIETRVGLHCAPLAHNFLGSAPEGCVRFSLSPYHTKKDLENLLSAIKESI